MFQCYYRFAKKKENILNNLRSKRQKKKKLVFPQRKGLDEIMFPFLSNF